MERLKNALERLDETISDLEDKVGLDASQRLKNQKKQAEIIKLSRAREANILTVAQKVGLRLDQTIEHIENIMKN